MKDVTAPRRRHYLLANNEAEACASAAALLATDIQHINVLRAMANWEIEIYCPFPDELIAAP